MDRPGAWIHVEDKELGAARIQQASPGHLANRSRASAGKQRHKERTGRLEKARTGRTKLRRRLVFMRTGCLRWLGQFLGSVSGQLPERAERNGASEGIEESTWQVREKDHPGTRLVESTRRRATTISSRLMRPGDAESVRRQMKARE